MRFGLDYAWGTITPAEHKAIGSTFACRYLSKDPTKNLTINEKNALEAAGVDIVVVWEATANAALHGKTQGVADARAALTQAQSLGMPAGRPIYFAVDFDETPGQATAVAEYFQGVHEVLDNAGPADFPTPYLVGAYGGYWAVKRLFDDQVIEYGWQTYAWSGGNRDPRAQLYQYSNGHAVAGVGCDYNHSYADDFGQWGFDPAPKPAPEPKGVAHATLSFDVATKSWTLKPLPGEVVWRPEEKWASLEVQLGVGGKVRGRWRTQPMPWNAGPLGS